MTYAIRQLLLTALACLLLPLAGLEAAGMSAGPYLQFPPATTLYIAHAGFSPLIFACGGILGFCGAAWCIHRLLEARQRCRAQAATTAFPWWGYCAAATAAAAWIVAWNRFPLFAPVQDHTFTPLWLSYVVLVNACCHRRLGHCPLLAQPGRFALLFPLSAGFWWLYEYLNRFVQNWLYLLPEQYQPIEYFFFATVPFSTVLPAVYSTAELLQSYPLFMAAFATGPRLPLRAPRLCGALIVAAAAASLFFLPLFPNLLYPVLWLAPLLLWIGFDLLWDCRSIFPECAGGNWQRVFCWGLGALLCGFFWELWNYNSLAKWVYEVPFVGVFKIFEMPLLGYFGYLPFGAACAAAASLIFPRLRAAAPTAAAASSAADSSESRFRRTPC